MQDLEREPVVVREQRHAASDPLDHLGSHQLTQVQADVWVARHIVAPAAVGADADAAPAVDPHRGIVAFEIDTGDRTRDENEPWRASHDAEDEENAADERRECKDDEDARSRAFGAGERPTDDSKAEPRREKEGSKDLHQSSASLQPAAM
jgi:hypothetical protein